MSIYGQSTPFLANLCKILCAADLLHTQLLHNIGTYRCYNGQFKPSILDIYTHIP